MGHLGQGTEITTVQDKEIVLTASNGQHFRMKIADLAEAVRQVMPVVTNERNGLASPNSSLMFSDTIKDCNIVKQGVFRTTVNTKNMPEVKSGAAVLISIIGYTDGAYMFQLCFELLGDKLFFRNKTDADWLRWKSISFT